MRRSPAGARQRPGMRLAAVAACTLIIGVLPTAVGASRLQSGSALALLAATDAKVLFGDQNVEQKADKNDPGSAEAFRTKATDSGQVGSISIYVDQGSTATKLAVGVYTDRSNHPGVLLGTGSINGPRSGAWNSVTLGSQVPVTSGTTYWLAVLAPTNSGTLMFRDVRGQGASESNAQGGLSSLPSIWTTGHVWNDGPLSGYGVSIAVTSADTQSPSTPSGLAVSGASTSSVSVSWQAASDNVGVAGYGLYSNGSSVGSSQQTSYTFSGLSCGNSYTIAVDAYDAAGNRSGKAQITASTSSCPAPGDKKAPTTPSSLSRTGATTTSISVSWGASSDNVGVAGYGAYRNGTNVGSTQQTSYSFTGLTCGTSYTLAVDAYDAANNRSAQAQITASTSSCPAPGDTQAPTAPTLKGTSSTTTSITLSWNPSTDNVGVAGYGLYSGSSSAGSTQQTSYSFTGLTCGTSYTLAVDAYDAAGNRSGKTQTSASTSACPPPSDTQAPSVPGSLAVSGASATSISVSWKVSTDNVGVAGYGAYNNGAIAGSTQQTSYSFTGLTCGTSYTLAVDAYDAANNHSAKASVTASTSACTTSANLFLSPSGADTNACSASAPCKSFDRAYDLAQPGQVVQLAAGSYGAQNLSGSKSADVIFQPASGATVTAGQVSIHASHIEIRNVNMDSFRTWNDTSYVTFRNDVIHWFALYGGQNISVIGGEVYPTQIPVQTDYDPVMSEDGAGQIPQNILFDGVRFHDWTRPAGSGFHTECFQIGAGINVTIRNSRFWNCATHDVFIRSWGNINNGVHTIKGFTIENNFFAKTTDGYYSIQFLNDLGLSKPADALIRNNSFLQGVRILNDGTTAVKMINNALSDNDNCNAVQYSHNIVESGTVCGSDRKATVAYVNRAGFDLHLASGSVAIDAGDPASYPATDIDGQGRPSGSAPDVGADEYAGSSPAPSPPANTALPAVSGTAQQGQTLTASNGSWSNSPTGYAYQWRRCNASGASCADIANAKSQTYVLASGDVSSTVRVVVTASNAAGSGSATSNQTAVVQSAPTSPSPPANTVLPAISGTAQAGSTLTTSNGTWSNSPTSYAYQWRRCDSAGANCLSITGAQSQSYVATSSDVGLTLRAIVTATNSGGSVSATSGQTSAVQAAASAPASGNANLWVDANGGSCTRTATAAAYNDATACGTVSAAWSAAQGGDTILIRGNSSGLIYTSGFSASGAKSSTVTISVPSGESAWFAGDGSLSGVTNMLVTDDRPVTNPSTLAGVGNGLAFGMETIGGSSANIAFRNVDEYCQNRSPWHMVTGPNGTSCNASFLINGVNGFSWIGGSNGPTAACINSSPCSGGDNVNNIGPSCSSNAACQNILIQNVVFHDVRRLDGNTHMEAIKIDQGTGITLRDNWWFSCDCNSAVIFFGASSGKETADNVLVEGNVIGNSGAGGGKGIFDAYNYPSGTAHHFTYRYNTVDGPIQSDPTTGTLPGTNVRLEGNTAWRQLYSACTPSGATFVKNTWYTDPSTNVAQCGTDNPGIKQGASSLFVSPGAPNWNYHLQSTSPLIDAGGTGANGMHDIDNQMRPMGAADDVGADESR